MSIKMSLHQDTMDELQPGDTTRVNHEDCSAGEDTRRRLYLTRPLAKPTLVLGYCHNCQQEGFHSTKKYETYRDNMHVHGAVCPPIVVDELSEPISSTGRVLEWPTEARCWAIQSRLVQSDIKRYKILFDINENKIWLPRYDRIEVNGNDKLLGTLEGYQLRRLSGKGAKYTTVTSKNDKGYTSILCTNREITKAVIVEDYVSGIHIANAFQATPLHVIVNYGVKTNPFVAQALSGVEHTTVWLDNDNDHVERQAAAYARTIALYSGNEVGVVGHLNDPKHHSPKVIRDALERIWTA